MNIRPETPSDIPQIRTVHLTAFPTAGEADLVDNLRTSKDVVYSLVATKNNAIIAHCTFSRMISPTNTLGLGPVATLPEFRRQGVAERMIHAGIDLATQDAWSAIFVLGNPRYYQRFGFDPKLAKNFPSPYSGPTFMALPLDKAKFDNLTGPAQYPLAFDEV